MLRDGQLRRDERRRAARWQLGAEPLPVGKWRLLQQHAAALEENGFALADASGLTSGDLAEMGIAKLKERKDMLKVFQAYAASCAD